MENNNCVFCRIINGEIPSYKIYENEYVYAFLDIADDAIGHTLVIPKRHFTNICDVPEEDYLEVMKAVKLISKHYTKDCGFTGVNILNASGKDAEQSVFHLHFHIIPRCMGDGLKMWPELLKKDCDFESVQNRLKMF